MSLQTGGSGAPPYEDHLTVEYRITKGDEKMNTVHPMPNIEF